MKDAPMHDNQKQIIHTYGCFHITVYVYIVPYVFLFFFYNDLGTLINYILRGYC